MIEGQKGNGMYIKKNNKKTEDTRWRYNEMK